MDHHYSTKQTTRLLRVLDTSLPLDRSHFFSSYLRQLEQDWGGRFKITTTAFDRGSLSSFIIFLGHHIYVPIVMVHAVHIHSNICGYLRLTKKPPFRYDHSWGPSSSWNFGFIYLYFWDLHLLFHTITDSLMVFWTSRNNKKQTVSFGCFKRLKWCNSCS